VRFPISGNRESRYRESRCQEVGNFHSKSPGNDLNRPSFRTRVRNPKRVRNRRIGDPEDRIILQLEIAKRDIPTG
jgi:hypothetical protein